jgi:hypothetical protein
MFLIGLSELRPQAKYYQYWIYQHYLYIFMSFAYFLSLATQAYRQLRG